MNRADVLAGLQTALPLGVSNADLVAVEARNTRARSVGPANLNIPLITVRCSSNWRSAAPSGVWPIRHR